MTRKEHNGWTNYETWLVKLWIDNSQGDQEYWSDRAQEAYDHATGDDDKERRDNATTDLAESLKEEHEERANELVGMSGMYADLMGAALSEVDWYQIAQSLTENVETED